MAETMEQYMSNTRADYGSGFASPKIEDKDNFELKGLFLKELCTNTFSSSDHEDANEHIEKEVILFYNGLGIPTRQILDSRGTIPSKTAADAKIAIQEMAEYSQKWHNGTSRLRSTESSDGLAAIQAQLNNLRREIKKVNEKVYVAQNVKELMVETSSNLVLCSPIADQILTILVEVVEEIEHCTCIVATNQIVSVISIHHFVESCVESSYVTVSTVVCSGTCWRILLLAGTDWLLWTNVGVLRTFKNALP
ncbi:hypothetical protein Tco_0071454 [Tanacetum coccineum]